LLALITVVVTGRLIVHRHAGNASAQDADKTLDMERYPNEPLALVDIKIGEQPVKDKIARKSRTPDEGLDTVKFRERNDWHRRVWLRLRNVSGEAIISLRAYLYFQPPAHEPCSACHSLVPGRLRADRYGRVMKSISQ
jgi:hypothetical protein